jgi:hypothetical protein
MITEIKINKINTLKLFIALEVHVFEKNKAARIPKNATYTLRTVNKLDPMLTISAAISPLPF